jgi:hypothetical protein
MEVILIISFKDNYVYLLKLEKYTLAYSRKYFWVNTKLVLITFSLRITFSF